MAVIQTEWQTTLQRDGFAILRHAVPQELLNLLTQLCEAVGTRPEATRRGDSVYGIRMLLSLSPEIRTVVSDSPFIDWAKDICGERAQAVSSVYFDKTPDANWPVPWHQDQLIRVRESRPVAGFESRPVKDGIVHMLPPVELSNQILAMRIHLDDATATHGALRVIPGSHHQGRVSNEQLAELTSRSDTVTCDVRAGDVMLMRPLLLHASSRCEQPGHRRVIHIEYAGFDLPGGLKWQG